MSKKLLNQLKTRLKTRRDFLLKEINLRLKEIKDSGGYRFTDTADIASNIRDDSIVISVAQGEAREIEQIDNALKKLKSGEYGICERCGKKINNERLKAIPFVNLCIKCKEAEEREEELSLQDVNHYGTSTENYSTLDDENDDTYSKQKNKMKDFNPYDN
jgi:DnaK suppressor protein